MANNIFLSNILKLQYKNEWRKYQWRVLCELENYLDDKKLNVVAAPGAGKTTLGIEVINRLNKPALILVPSNTIKSQWKERICADFISSEKVDCISTDTKIIRPITITTYQMLHSINKDKEALKQFANILKQNGIKTVVLDEAHHLRTEWYKTIINLCEELDSDNFTTVALTGTPPYDVSAAEWNNYHTLCGPVDAEISIPELVKQKNLCPHQDLIWFSKPEKDEEYSIEEIENNRKSFMNYLKNDSDFLYSVKTSEFLNITHENIEKIYEDVDFTVAVVSYLLWNDDLDTTASLLINFLQLDKTNIPPFDEKTAETLLNGILNKQENNFKNVPKIKGLLKDLNLLETSKKVNLTHEPKLKRLLSFSKSKIQAVNEITKAEYKNLGQNLREVILLDYIGNSTVKGLNVISVFESLKNQPYKTAVLTGSLVVIPSSLQEELKAECSNNFANIILTEYCDNYLRVETYGNVDIVLMITKLFNRGAINVLIGTQSLLGEGWDSPCINTLIIASTVGSFMLSNQLRGRAIRLNNQNTEKISDIWHLAAIKEEELHDFHTVARRFNTFEGVSFTDDAIRNGIERLGLNLEDIKNINCEDLNNIQKQRAANRQGVAEMWQQVFKESEIKEAKLAPRVYSAIEMKKPEKHALLIKYEKYKFFKNVLIPFFMKRKIKKESKRTSVLIYGLLETLNKIKLIKTNPFDIDVKLSVTKNFQPYITLVGCSDYERNLFFDIFSELFSKPVNQRYILKGKDFYITVPEKIGGNKNNVKIFVKAIEPYFGYLDIIYTRTPDGRKEFVKAVYQKSVDKTVKTTRIWI